MRSLSIGTFLLLLICASLAWGSTSGPLLWDTTGVAIRQGFEVEWERGGDMDAQGNMVYVWSDTRKGDRDVYAQRINSNGEPTWTANGLQIIHYLNRQEDPSVVATGFGSYIFIWNDFRNDIAKGDMYAQRVDAAGNLKWGVEGRLVTTGDFDSPAEFRMVADGTGGAILVWNDLRYNNEDIYATRIDSNGIIPPEWQMPPQQGVPVIVEPANQSEISVDTDGQGGAIVAWTSDLLDAVHSDKEIYAQRIRSNGTLAWSPDSTGLAICDTIRDQETPKICSDGSGGAFIVWHDKRTDDIDGDLFFQHINANGQYTTSAPQGLPLVQLANKQEQQRLVADGFGNAIVVWMDSRNDPGNVLFNVYAQKINAAGQKLWNPQDGVPVCINPSGQEVARLSGDGLGNAVCTWMDMRNGNQTTENIYAQKINADGSMAWTTDGVIVCDALDQQSDPLVRSQAGYSLIAWGDKRSGSLGMWYQKMDANGNRLLTAEGDTLVWGIGGNAVNATIVRNNTDRMFVFFEDYRDGSAGASIFVQAVDTLGHIQLDTNGVKVCPAPIFTSNRSQKNPAACSDGGNGALVIWLDQRDSNPNNQIYAQHVGASGNLLWGNAGIAVTPASQLAHDQLGAASIVSDGSDGGIVVWSAAPTSLLPNNLYATKLSSSGSLAWPIITVSTVSGEDIALEDLVPDGNGGAYVAYQGGEWDNLNVFGQHLSSTGSLLWGDGVLLCTDSTNQINCRVISLGVDGAEFVWVNQVNFNADIYAQKVNVTGQIEWGPRGMPVCTAPQDQDEPDLAIDSYKNVFVVWKDTRIDTDWNIYIQKITPNGQILYPLNGMAVNMAPFAQGGPKILADANNGNYVFWEDSRATTAAGTNLDVYGSHLTGDGTLSPYGAWNTDGNWINQEIMNQYNIRMTDDFIGGVMSVWDDQRSSGKATVDNVYAQRVNERGVTAVLISDPSVPSIFKLLNSYPNPFNPSVRLRFTLNHPGNVRLSIWDVAGRQVAVLKDGWQRAGLSEVTWDGDNFASGIYFVRLQFENKNQQQKILLLK